MVFKKKKKHTFVVKNTKNKRGQQFDGVYDKYILHIATVFARLSKYVRLYSLSSMLRSLRARLSSDV